VRVRRALASFTPAALTLAACLLVFALQALRIPFLERTELATYDLRVQARGALVPSPAVAMVVVDEKSLAAEGRWPWPREKIAALVDALSQGGARVVAFDVAFPEPESDAADGALAAAIGRSRARVVLGYFLHQRAESAGAPLDAAEVERRVRRVGGSRWPVVRTREPDLARAPLLDAYAPQPNLDALTAAAASSGFIGLASDADGVLRRAPLAIRVGEDLLAPLPLVAAWEFLGRPEPVLSIGRHGVEGVELGERLIPTDDRARLLVDYLGPPGTIPAVSATDVLRGAVPPGTFTDRLVFVGATAAGVHDLRTSPFSAVHPGAEINATVAENVLSARFLSRPDWWIFLDLLAAAGLSALVALGGSRARALGGVALLGALSAGWVFLAGWLFVRRGIWVSVLYPLLAAALVHTVLAAWRYLGEARERRRIRTTFGQYVAPAVVDAMLADPGRLRLGGEEKVLTVLFSDLEGFTAQCERLAPGEMVEILGAYFGRMTEGVFAHGGTLKEYVGDELMAFFGAPLEQDDHAARACAAALEMAERRRALNVSFAAAGRPALRARTGINTGPMLVGNLGSTYRFAYGVLGDEVNLGSRLEGLNREYGTEILVGEGTASAAGPAFLFREVDLVRVKGKARAVRVHELVARGGDALPEGRRKALETYAAALAAYRAQRWGEALALFEEALGAWPDDGPSRTLARRCRAYLRSPPADEWDGAFDQGAVALRETG
jgi:adenylate cyclase